MIRFIPKKIMSNQKHTKFVPGAVGAFVVAAVVASVFMQPARIPNGEFPIPGFTGNVANGINLWAADIGAGDIRRIIYESEEVITFPTDGDYDYHYAVKIENNSGNDVEIAGVLQSRSALPFTGWGYQYSDLEASLEIQKITENDANPGNPPHSITDIFPKENFVFIGEDTPDGYPNNADKTIPAGQSILLYLQAQDAELAASVFDRDGDRLNAVAEAAFFGTSDDSDDYDNDTWKDSLELLAGSDPNDINSYPGSGNPGCGNGVVEDGETCDDGKICVAANGEPQPDSEDADWVKTCKSDSDCLSGNTCMAAAGDGCDESCQLENDGWFCIDLINKDGFQTGEGIGYWMGKTDDLPIMSSSNPQNRCTYCLDTDPENNPDVWGKTICSFDSRVLARAWNTEDRDDFGMQWTCDYTGSTLAYNDNLNCQNGEGDGVCYQEVAAGASQCNNASLEKEGANVTETCERSFYVCVDEANNEPVINSYPPYEPMGDPFYDRDLFGYIHCDPSATPGDCAAGTSCALITENDEFCNPNDDGSENCFFCNDECRLRVLWYPACGNGIVESFLGAGAQRTDPAEITDYLNQLQANIQNPLDVNQDGIADNNDALILRDYFRRVRFDSISGEMRQFIKNNEVFYDADNNGKTVAEEDIIIISLYLTGKTGDGLTREECDDKNSDGLDGCAAGSPYNGGCQVEEGWTCTGGIGELSTCNPDVGESGFPIPAFE